MGSMTKGFWRFVGAACVAAACVFATGPAVAQSPGDSLHHGPLRGRDLTPFGFLRLDMRPAHAVVVPPGQWAVEANLGYQNTWALSGNVEEYLQSLPGRRRLGPGEFQAIRDLPGEAYLADFELGLLDLSFHRRLDSHWSAFATLGIAWFGGGFLDGLVEGFHDRFGFDDYGRPAVERDGANFLFDLDGVHAQQQGVPRRGGLLDPTLGVRYAMSPRPDPWNLVLEAAMKVPVGGRRDFLSNGHLDLGVQATVQRISGAHGFYASLAAVYTKASLAGQAFDEQVVPTAMAAYEYAWNDCLALIGQFSASRGAFDRGITRLDALRDPKYQYALGLRYKLSQQRAAVTLAITENVKNVNNTPDIGFQLGFVWWP